MGTVELAREPQSYTSTDYGRVAPSSPTHLPALYPTRDLCSQGVYEGVMPGGVKVAKRGAGEIDSSAVTTVTASSTSASTSGEDRCNAYPPANIAGGKLPYKVRCWGALNAGVYVHVLLIYSVANLLDGMTCK